MNSERIAFQYSLLRYTHDIVTGEYLNVGLVVYSKQYRYFKAQLSAKYRRITSCFPGADGDFYKRYINHFQVKLDQFGLSLSSNQIKMFEDLPDQLNILLAMLLPLDDSAIQFGEVQSGIATDLDDAFSQLNYRLVERYIDDNERDTRADEQVWTVYSKPLRLLNVLDYLKPKKIKISHDEIEFERAWKNGNWNIIQPLSFDLANPTYIRKKARTWLGTNILLDQSDEMSSMYYLLGRPQNDEPKLQQAYLDAKDILLTHHYQYSVKLVEEHQAETFAEQIKPQIEADVHQHENDE